VLPSVMGVPDTFDVSTSAKFGRPVMSRPDVAGLKVACGVMMVPPVVVTVKTAGVAAPLWPE